MSMISKSACDFLLISNYSRSRAILRIACVTEIIGCCAGQLRIRRRIPQSLHQAPATVSASPRSSGGYAANRLPKNHLHCGRSCMID